jgi:hypothetical protein
MNLPGRRLFKGDTIYSDWFPRGGDNMIFRAQRLAVVDSASPDAVTVTITVYTKNSHDTTGPGLPVKNTDVTGDPDYAIVLSAGSEEIEQTIIVSGDSETAPVDGLLELVRFKCVCANGNADASVLFRIFPPVFFDQAYTA